MIRRFGACLRLDTRIPAERGNHSAAIVCALKVAPRLFDDVRHSTPSRVIMISPAQGGRVQCVVLPPGGFMARFVACRTKEPRHINLRDL